MTKNKVAIIGYGYVGKAVHKIFPDALIYDYKFEKGIDNDPVDGSPYSNQFTINSQCELAIVCVPTPMCDKAPEDLKNEFAKVDISIVEDTINWLETNLILIKSTIPPQTTDYLVKKYNKKICFSPEYIGEGKYQITSWRYLDAKDPRLHDFLIIGGESQTAEAITNIFVQKLGPEKFYYLCSAIEAELIKYMENSWGAMKVIFAQEFYELCQKLGVSWIKVREGWALDNRVERMHTAVFVDNRGFGGKCYPKDLNGIVVIADELGVDLSLVKATLRKNRALRPNEQL